MREALVLLKLAEGPFFEADAGVVSEVPRPRPALSQIRLLPILCSVLCSVHRSVLDGGHIKQQ